MLALIALGALALGATQAPAQSKTARPAPATRAASATDTLAADIAARRAAGDKYLPNADHFTYGNRSIAANTTVDGPIAVAHGDLDVYGTVNGDVVTLYGNIRVHRSARVTGDAWAVGGTVLIDGGLVEGERRAITGAGAAAPAPSPQPRSTWQSVKLVIGWFALLAILGIGVMVFADPNLDGVVVGVERGFARAFWIGVAGQVVLLPALLVIVVALAITLIGVLLIPFAVVAYVIAAAGLIALGFLGVSRLVGKAFASTGTSASPRGVHLHALMIGLTGFMGMWLIAALCVSAPYVGPILRAIAIAVTWVSATVGLGATIVSRAGTQRPGAGSLIASPADDLAWQTPTPVAGVAASRRPASVR
ncbi:MAG TPA: hypothetical protein VN600_01845 [Gemmatimonadaceae bacterium]|nr:hypothetical protein [Gemmatimonadaceae bacterium]